MSKRRTILLIVLLVFLTPILVTTLALQNAPWTHSAFIRNAQSFISGLILSRVNVVTIPKNQDLERVTAIPFPKLLALQKGDIEIISASALPDESTKGLLNRFTIATIEPHDLRGKSRTEQRRIIKAVDDLAIQGRIDVIVEATASDAIRCDDWGLEETKRLHDAGVIRCVIFDGGHHVGPLQLEPDILLAPVTDHGGMLYAGHWFTRDAVPIWKLEEALDEGEIDSMIAQFPRFGIPVKNKNGMARIAAQAILKAAESRNLLIATPNQRPLSDSISYHWDNESEEGSMFLSLNTSCKAAKEDILKWVREKTQKSGQNTEDIKRLYIGLTFGNSRFPHVSEKAEIDGEELESFLSEHLPYEVSIISEPLSTWDIYLCRFGIYP